MGKILKKTLYKLFLFSYNIIFYLVSIVLFIALPFLHKKYKDRVRQALLLDSPRINSDKKYIWIHGTSFGEVLSSKSLIESIINKYENEVEVIITCEIEKNMIKEIFNGKIECFYLPPACSFFIEKFIRLYNPSLVIFLERCFYPVLMHQIKKKKLLALLLNAIVPSPSFLLWKKNRFLLQEMLKTFEQIYPMSIIDKRVIDSINKKDNKCIGNIKYTNLKTREKIFSKHRDMLNNLIGVFQGYYIIAAHCIHNKEEKIIIDLHNNLQSKGFKIKTIIIPRRSPKTMLNSFQENDIDVTLFSNVLQKKFSNDIIVVDSMGYTNVICYLSDITFIGKSLYLKGGHNLLEPLSMGSPVIFGKNMYFFKDIVKSTLKYNAGIEIGTESELFTSIVHLLSHPDDLATLRKNTSFVHDKANNLLSEYQKEVFKYLPVNN